MKTDPPSLHLILSTALALVTLVGCSSTPSHSDIRNALESRIKEKSNGAMRLLSFTTSNERGADAMGKKLYLLDYKAEIEVTADCFWGGSPSSFEVIVGEPSQYSSSYLEGKKRVQKGQRVSVSGTLRFELADEGWREEAPGRPFSILPPADRDLILGDLSRIAALAFEYRQRPSQNGGGGGSYIGFTVSPDVAQGVTVVSVGTDEIVIEKEGVRGTVDSNGALRTH